MDWSLQWLLRRTCHLQGFGGLLNDAHSEKYGLSANYRLLGEVTGEKGLSTLQIYFKNKCPVLIPDTQDYICLSVQVVSSGCEYGLLTQKD